jgi:hypothetical protein
MYSPGRKRQRRYKERDNPLERFENPLPDERADWYKARTSPDADKATDSNDFESGSARAPDGDSGLIEDLGFGEEGNADEGLAEKEPEENPERLLRPRKKGAFVDGEVPERLRFKTGRSTKEDGAVDVGGSEKGSAAPLTRESLKELKENYKKLGSSGDLAKKWKPLASRDFREVHREAVKAKNTKEVADFDSLDGVKQAGRSLIPLTWIVLAGGGLLVALAAVFAGALGDRSENVELKPIEGGEFAELPKETADAVIERFFSAESWEDLLKDVRSPEKVKPLMESWYAIHRHEPDEFEILEVTEGMMSTGGISAPDQLWIIHVSIQLSKRTAPSSAFLERTSVGFKVDWESTVGNSPLLFETFASRVGTPESDPVALRVSISPCDYYNYDFADRNEWQSFDVRHPVSDRVLSGYLKKGDKEEALMPLFYPGESSIPVIAKLQFPDAESKKRGQVEIVQKNWMRRY